MQAVKKFEPEKGFKLATYAMWWIKASIQEYILRSWSLEKKINNFNRQALHAKSLGFNHPRTGREIFFEAKRPEDFDALIKNLKKASI